MTMLNTYQAGKRVRDMLLNALTFSSGAIDAISFIALGKIFTAFMTGNIAFLGIRASGNSSPEVVSILISMLSFAAGVLISTRIVRSIKYPELWSHRVTVALSLTLIAQAAFLVVWFAVDGRPSTDTVRYLLGFW